MKAFILYVLRDKNINVLLSPFAAHSKPCRPGEHSGANPGTGGFTEPEDAAKGVIKTRIKKKKKEICE